MDTNECVAFATTLWIYNYRDWDWRRGGRKFQSAPSEQESIHDQPFFSFELYNVKDVEKKEKAHVLQLDLSDELEPSLPSYTHIQKT